MLGECGLKGIEHRTALLTPGRADAALAAKGVGTDVAMAGAGDFQLDLNQARPRSAWLLSNGTAMSSRKASASCSQVHRRSSRLRVVDCLRRPRRRGALSAAGSGRWQVAVGVDCRRRPRRAMPHSRGVRRRAGRQRTASLPSRAPSQGRAPTCGRKTTARSAAVGRMAHAASQREVCQRCQRRQKTQEARTADVSCVLEWYEQTRSVPRAIALPLRSVAERRRRVCQASPSSMGLFSGTCAAGVA